MIHKTAVTGVSSFLGARLLQRLVETAGPDELLAVDIASPPAALGVRHRFLDLTQPASDQRLLDLLKDEAVDTVVHMAFSTSPRRDAAYAHELESIGTLSVLAASAAAGVRQILMRSFTAIYGARGQNPSFLGEDQPLQPNASLRWVRDKVEAETHAASFGKRYPEMTVTVLRLAPLMGPGVRTFYTRIFDKRVVPTLMGYDPLMQALHPEDALTAIEMALERRRGGVFNVVPRSAIPLASAIHLSAKVPVPVPHPIAYAASDLLWSAGLAEAPGAFLDYVRYPVVADGAKAKRELGFEARYSSREAFQAYLRYRHPGERPRTLEARA